MPEPIARKQYPHAVITRKGYDGTGKESISSSPGVAEETTYWPAGESPRRLDSEEAADGLRTLELERGNLEQPVMNSGRAVSAEGRGSGQGAPSTFDVRALFRLRPLARFQGQVTSFKMASGRQR